MQTSAPILDQDIRRVLINQLDSQGGVDGECTKIIQELGVNYGANRIDVAVLGVDGFCGYEIKSDRDDLSRLPEQVKAYNAVFDAMYLVIGMRSILQAIELIPDWWGITLAKTNVNGRLVLITIRQAHRNHDIQSLAIAQLLWREEALACLEYLGSAQGFRSKTRLVIHEHLAKRMGLRTLQDIVRAKLCLNLTQRFDQLQQTYDDW